jgi:ribosomal protein L40E
MRQAEAGQSRRQDNRHGKCDARNSAGAARCRYVRVVVKHESDGNFSVAKLAKIIGMATLPRRAAEKIWRPWRFWQRRARF